MRKIVSRIFLLSLLLFIVVLTLAILRWQNILHFSRPSNMWLPCLIFACIAIISNTYRKKLKEKEEEKDIELFE